MAFVYTAHLTSASSGDCPPFPLLNDNNNLNERD